ncbi:MAG: type VI secretion system baseplate subunit TssE [Ramlibacter sp.]|nr:type VI secretion system baseplate subunit TssE [Ramlibacter sp.]
MEDLASERSEGDRLQPALLDRLTDDEPGQRTEPLQNAVVSKGRLKRTVLRDLAWLLNTTAHHTGDQLSSYPEVRKSVVNFGIPVLSGKIFSGVDWRELEHQIRDAILAFEPRILPDTLTVKALTPTDALGHHNLLQFELHGELWSVPYPLELLLRSELDLETGHVTLKDQFTTGLG